MWCICTIWPNAPESQSVTMPYSHQNYWMHVFCFFFRGSILGSEMQKSWFRLLSRTFYVDYLRRWVQTWPESKILVIFPISVPNFSSLLLHFTVKKCLKEIQFKFSSQYCDSENIFFLSFYFLFYALWKMCVGSVALWKTQDVAQLYFLFLFQKEI